MNDAVGSAPDARQRTRDLQEQLLQQLRADQASRQADIPPEALKWLALVPLWTAELAERSGFPAGSAGVEAILQRAADEDLCHRDKGRTQMLVEGTRLRSVDVPDSHWMDPTQRKTALDSVRQGTDGGSMSVQELLPVIGNRIRQAEAAGVDTPPEVRRWAALAAEAGTAVGAAQALRSRVKALLDDDGVEGPSPGEALRWIETARSLEPHLGAPILAAAGWAGRQLEIYHRRTHDDRHLEHYLDRPQLVGAFLDLVAGRHPDEWALHFAGAGGVGKTMLVRWVDSRWNREGGASTARVDFDYLNPDYPVLAPGLLLEKLADDLRLHDQTGAAEALFGHFRNLADALHERMQSPLFASSAAGDATDSPEYERMLEIFIDATSRLPQPVVLLLDTCEELAKVRPDGQVPESVEATFKILERLHDGLPHLRVVFSGRRALGSSGAGWRAPATNLPRRKHLRVVEVRGFTEDEAVAYLTPRVRPDLIPAILTRSADADDPDRFEWDDDAAAPVKVLRHNPFDVALYGDWAHECEDLTAAEILEAEQDQYVELRIVRRISAPLAQILPTVALLGRFDRDTLEAVSELAPDRFEEVLAELCDQEWIDMQRSGFLEVDRGLLPRLRAYYWKRLPSATERCRAPLARHLVDITTSRPLSDLDRSHFDAAIQVLERNPQEAAAWWDRMERRFADESMYRWALELTGSLSDGEGAVAAQDPGDGDPVAPHALRAAVLATRAAALGHCRPRDDVDRIWAEVGAIAASHPTVEGGQRLRWRALAGRIAQTRYATEASSADEDSELVAAIDAARNEGADEQVAAAFLAAVEALTERAEVAGDGGPHMASAKLEDWAGAAGFAAEIRAFACALRARVAAARGGDGLTESLFWFRRTLAALPGQGPTVQRWSDWRAPDEAWARVRLEMVRALYPALLSPEETLRELGWHTSADGRFPPASSVDSARLAAAMLRLVLAVRLPTGEELQTLTEASDRLVPGIAACRAHASIAPLFAVVAEATSAVGMVGRALEANDSHRRNAEQTRLAFETALAAERSSLLIHRRMRLRDEGRGLSPDLTQSADLEDWELLWALDGLEGGKRAQAFAFPSSLGDPDHGPEGARRAWCHARWRGTFTQAADRAVDAAGWAAATLPGAPPGDDVGFPDVSTALDGLEARLMVPSLPRRWSGGGRVAHPVDPAGWWAAHPDRPVDAVVIYLRCAVLDAFARRPSIPDGLMNRVGARRCAELALDEGELLALRLPKRAELLLEQACTLFEQSGDPAGALIAAASVAICRARRPDPDRAGVANAIGIVERTYRQLTETPDLGLPPWEALTVIAVDPSDPGLDALGPLEWRPWMVRVIASMAWLADGAAPRAHSAAVLSWLGKRYACRAADGPAVFQPAELDGWLEPRQRDLRWLRRVRAVILGVAGIVAFCWLGVVTEEQAGPPALLFYSVLFAAAWLAWRRAASQARQYVRIGSHRRRRLATIDAGPRLYWNRKLPNWFLGGAIVAVGLGTIPVFVYRWLRWCVLGVAVGRPAPTSAYREASRTLPRSVRREFRRLRKRLREQPAPVELRVDLEHSAVCWEGLLSLCAPRVKAPADLGLSFQRTMQQRGLPPSDALRNAKAVTSWTPLGHESQARNGWDRVAENPAFGVSFVGGESREELLASLGGRRTAVLHVVAPVLRTASGVRLQLRAPAPVAGASRPASTSGRGELLRADDLVELFPELALCIIQAPPSSTDERTVADRDQAACLRQLAAELFSCGQLTAVIALPPLPDAIGNVAIREIARSLQHGTGLVGLRQAVISAQRAVGDWGSASPEDALEAALDMCVYCSGPLGKH